MIGRLPHNAHEASQERRVALIVIHNNNARRGQIDAILAILARLRPLIGHTTIERHHVRGHNVELILFEALLHLVLPVVRYDNGATVLARPIGRIGGLLRVVLSEPLFELVEKVLAVVFDRCLSAAAAGLVAFQLVDFVESLISAPHYALVLVVVFFGHGSHVVLAKKLRWLAELLLWVAWLPHYLGRATIGGEIVDEEHVDEHPEQRGQQNNARILKFGAGHGECVITIFVYHYIKVI